MNTKLKNELKLRNLTYADLVSNLSQVCPRSYSLPNSDDSCTMSNNEVSFEAWKQKMLLKYPTATVTLDPHAAWYDRVKINDNSYLYDKQMFIAAKAESLMMEGYR